VELYCSAGGGGRGGGWVKGRTPQTLRIIKFVMGMLGLDSVLLTEDSDLGVSSLTVIGGSLGQTGFM
jgi:hypothetical protein